MKQLIMLLLLFVTILTTPSLVSAQVGTQSGVSTDDHTAREEKEGKEIWEKLQTKKLKCANLTDDNFEALGEYFMGQMIGNSHEAMNSMMERMLGEEGEQQMHVVMGKRMSNCEPNAPMPQNMPVLSGVEGMNGGMMPMMMKMMMGMTTPLRQGFAGQEGGGNSMMGNYGWNNMMGGWGLIGVITWIALLAFLILGSVYFWKEIQRKK